MARERLSEDLRQFIAAHIDSVEQLEVLLLLRRHPDRVWNAEAVSRELRSASDSVVMRLQGLRSAGLLVSVSSESDGSDSFRYAPVRSELAELVDRLADAYASLRFTVINTIFEHPIEKIRSFADAFKFRRGD